MREYKQKLETLQVDNYLPNEQVNRRDEDEAEYVYQDYVDYYVDEMKVEQE